MSFQVFKRIAHKLLSLPERSKPSTPHWIQNLQRNGYTVTGDDKRGWRWHSPYWIESGRFYSERGAWIAAADDHNERHN